MTEQVGWFPSTAGALFAALHVPPGPSRGTAVVLVPPFGWEGMAAARNLRTWARSLAEHGHPTVRYHPPGSGDSAGDAAGQDMDSWTTALQDVLGATQAATCTSRLTVIGLGLGGLVAANAVARGAPVDDLVLWSTPSKGRLLLRELRAFARMTGDVDDPFEVEHDGVLWVHGYPVGARLQEQLAELDVATLDLRRVRRALVLGRGTLPADARLAAAFASAVSAPGPGYDELTVEPRLSVPPVAVMATVQAWLEASAPGPTAPLPQAGGERIVTQGPVSVIVHPVSGAALTAVFVGAGATPRSGPNRLWTEASQRWQSRGIASVRVDLEGIGEGEGPAAGASGPEALYAEEYRSQVRDVLDLAVAEGLPGNFLLVGLCSGGYWSVQTALADDRVRGVVVLNSYGLVWPPPLAPLSPRERLHHLTRLQTWQPLLHDKVLRRDALGRVRRSLRLLVDRFRREPEPGRSTRAPATTSQVLRALEHAGVQVTLGISPGEPLLDDLAVLPLGSTTRVVRFTGPRGAHTLSPYVLRAQAEQLLDEAADALL
ncbi:MAG: hypothetical protein JWO12_1460 [Frankiales bacterium]|nr:hypothetical protein [Frankiales bacterium]